MITVPPARTYPQPPTREAIVRRCATLAHQRENLDPMGAAYAATTMQLDDALSALFALGPLDPWGDPD